MSSDRTSEFFSVARSLPPSVAATRSNDLGTAPTTAAAAAKKKSDPAYTQLRSFHTTAAEISRDIAATSALLQELTDRVRKRSLLQDDAASMNQLVVRIKTSMENLNARLDAAGAMIQEQKRNLGKNSQAGQEASNLVDGLKTEFAQAASGFKQVLQQRTDNMKESDDMQRQVYGGLNASGAAVDHDPIPNISLNAPPPVYSAAAGGAMGAQGFPSLDLTSGMMPPGQSTSSGGALPRPHGIVQESSSFDEGMRQRHKTPDSLNSVGSLPTYSGGYSTYGQSSAPLTPLDIARMEEEQQLQTQLIPDQDYLRERADAMSTVETNIVELGTIFNKLAVMVNEHKEMVQRVEDNVEDTHMNVNLSLGTLTDTLENLRSNRQLALRVSAVLVLFIIMFIIFFA